MKNAIQCGSLEVEVEAQEWDSAILGVKCARIGPIRGQDPAPDFTPLTRELRNQGLDYVIARRPQGDWTTIHALERAGFVLVDGILSFERDLAKSTPPPPGHFRLATGADALAVAELAARTFTHSRFHNDPLLTPEIARRVHFEWARNSVLGPAADAVWLNEEAGQITGFCTCKITGASGSLVLIAVDKKFAGQGRGQALTEKGCAWLKEKGIKTAEVQTQTGNLAAMAAYFRAGFGLKSSSFTFRWAP